MQQSGRENDSKDRTRLMYGRKLEKATDNRRKLGDVFWVDVACDLHGDQVWFVGLG